MADEQQRVDGDGDKEEEPETGNSLENFVTNHYQKQKVLFIFDFCNQLIKIG